MAITTFMNLNLPTVLNTVGPDWATALNTAVETVDSHDHTSGKGKKVPTSGLDINANLNYQSYKAFNLMSTQYVAQGSTLTGASNALSIFTYSGNLYFTNGAGNAVQLTDGGSVVTSPGTVETLEYTSTSASLLIGPSDTFVAIAVDTGAPRTITLPLASAVSTGRIYAIKDSTGTANTNNITIATQGSDTVDGGSTYVLDSNYGAKWVISDGVSAWYII